MGHYIAEHEFQGVRIQGFSLAGEESFFVLPEMGIGFDVGRAPREVVLADHIFLTHGHMDHSAGLVYYFAQREFLDVAPGKLFAPLPLVEPIRKLLRLWSEIDGHAPPGEIAGAQAGVDIPVRRDLVVRPFEVSHPCRRSDRSVVTSLGYSVIEVRSKLHEEFLGLAGPEIVKLKSQGVEITRRVEVPLVCYCGDTTPGPFLNLPHVRDARVLLLECTFVDDDHMERAVAGNHMHVKYLPGVIASLRNERILLTHLSRRTAIADARAILKKHLGAEMDGRVSLFMEQRRKKSARSAAGPTAASAAREPGSAEAASDVAPPREPSAEPKAKRA